MGAVLAGSRVEVSVVPKFIEANICRDGLARGTRNPSDCNLSTSDSAPGFFFEKGTFISNRLKQFDSGVIFYNSPVLAALNIVGISP